MVSDSRDGYGDERI
jgi:hypothetical protein